MEFILETICPKNKWMGAYVKNLGEYADIGTDISFYNSNIETFFFVFFDSFGVEHVPKEIKNFLAKNI